MSPHTLVLIAGIVVLIGLHAMAHVWFWAEYATDATQGSVLSAAPETEPPGDGQTP